MFSCIYFPLLKRSSLSGRNVEYTVNFTSTDYFNLYQLII